MRIRATRITIKEYDVIEEYYPNGSTKEDILKIDTENFNNDPEMCFSNCDIDDIKLEFV